MMNLAITPAMKPMMMVQIIPNSTSYIRLSFRTALPLDNSNGLIESDKDRSDGLRAASAWTCSAFCDETELRGPRVDAGSRRSTAMPAGSGLQLKLNAISSLHRRQHRATITVPPRQKGCRGEGATTLPAERTNAKAELSQVEVELAKTIIQAGGSPEGGKSCYATPKEPADLLDRAEVYGSQIATGYCSGAPWPGDNVAGARRGVGTGGRGRSGDHGI